MKLINNLKVLLSLFILFFKVGLITFGGGYVMLGILEHELCERKKILTNDEMITLLAVSETTPGPFAINAATYIGHKKLGFWGAVFATIGVVFPSFLIIISLAFVLKKYNTNVYLKGFLTGIKAGVILLIFKAGFKLQKGVLNNLTNFFIFFVCLFLTLFTELSLIYIMVSLILISVATHKLNEELNKSKGGVFWKYCPYFFFS